MKRLKRNPEKFDVISLYSAIGRNQGYKIDAPKDFDDFIKRIGSSLKSSQENNNILHGKRVEALFSYVAGALGACKFIKNEDSGDAFSDDSEIIAPDYRVILKNGDQLFIEVKNCHFDNFQSPYPIKNEYIDKIERYAAMHGMPLKFAIYFSRFNRWVLLSKESLKKTKKKFVITFADAIVKNEMALLGDRTIATLPDLKLELLGSPQESPEIDESFQASFIIREVKIYSRDIEITDEIERDIAFYLIRFGEWLDEEPMAIMEGNKLLGASYIFKPELPSEGQDFQMIGSLSSMVSSAYREHTIDGQRVVALDTEYDPDAFSVIIPDKYKGNKLPLWQFIMQPNHEFKS